MLGGVLLSQDPAVQVPSALEGLTVVFGMGTCGTPPLSPPNMNLLRKFFRKLIRFITDCVNESPYACRMYFYILSRLHPENWIRNFLASYLRISPRPISIGQLHALLHFHPQPIYLVVFKGSYILGNLILRGASRLDAFSAYPFRT